MIFNFSAYHLCIFIHLSQYIHWSSGSDTNKSLFQQVFFYVLYRCLFQFRFFQIRLITYCTIRYQYRYTWVLFWFTDMKCPSYDAFLFFDFVVMILWLWFCGLASFQIIEGRFTRINILVSSENKPFFT